MSYLRSLMGMGPDPKVVAAVRSAPPLILPTEAKLVTVKPQTGAPDIQHFSAKAINDAIEENLSTLRKGESVVGLVWGDVDKDGKARANITVAGRLKKPVLGGKVEWTVYAHGEWHRDVRDARVGTMWRWSR